VQGYSAGYLKCGKRPAQLSDIDGHWSEKNIEALIDAGIIDPADYPDGFHPDDPITRAEIIKMLVRAEGKDEEAKNTQGHSGYDDQSDIKDEDKGYVIIGREDGIIGIRMITKSVQRSRYQGRRRGYDRQGQPKPEPAN
jgi:hypothetical protein